MHSSIAVRHHVSLSRRLRRDFAFALAWFGFRIAAVLTLTELRAVAHLLWKVAFVLPPLRKVLIANLEIAFHGEHGNLVARHCAHLAGLSAELLYVATGRTLPPYPLEARAQATLRAHTGQPVVLVSLHLANWERVARSLASACTITVVTKAPSDERYRPWYAQLRYGMRSIERDSNHAGVAMLRTLRRGEVLGIPMDLRTRVECAEVAFFGTSTLAPIGPARLALRTGAVVLLASATPNGTVDVTEVETGEVNDARALTAEIYRQLEQRIRAYPEAWLWLHKRWS